jgi:hypothetical protein
MINVLKKDCNNKSSKGKEALALVPRSPQTLADLRAKRALNCWLGLAAISPFVQT